jgi:hypothetical protein
MFGHPYAILRTPTRYPFIAIFEPCPQTVPKRTQEIRFLRKIGFLKPCPRCPKNPIFWKNRISFEMEWSGNFRFRVLT